MRLMREVRFFDGDDDCGQAASLGGNRWAGTNQGDAIPPFWTIRAVLEGPVDPGTGYLCDIKQIDATVRKYVASHVRRLNTGDRVAGVSELSWRMREAYAAASPYAPPPTRLESLQLRLSPYTHLTINRGDPTMVRLTQSFEFSASHRLFCEGLSDAENRRLFGKCSNPHGHGHNYVLEVTIGSEPDARTGALIDIGALDRIVHERVIEPLDHKNLNVECPEFANLNPTVENIARVIFRRLTGTLGDRRLLSTRVWETPKTYAECSGET